MLDLRVNSKGAFQTKPDPKWDYPTAFSSWGPEEEEAIQRVFEAQRFTMGAEVEAFESEFALYHGMKYGIMVNSGSSANLIIIAALRLMQKIQPRDEAVVPAIAWSTTYAPLVQHNLRLRVEDVDNSWNMIGPDLAGAKLCVAVSILGNPAKLNFLRTAADANGCILIEDNCESLGAWHANERCGTFGLMNSFSFFFSHQISAIEGGMILTNDAELAARARVLRAHGWTRDVRTPAGFDDEYNFVSFGYNVRPLELHAAIAREQLRKLKGFVDQRARNMGDFWGKLCDAFGTDDPEDLPIQPPVLCSSQPSPFGIAFTTSGVSARAKLVGALRAHRIDCRLPTGGSFRMHPYGAAWAGQETPVADRIHQTGLFLGNAPWPIPELIDRAVKVIKETI